MAEQHCPQPVCTGFLDGQASEMCRHEINRSLVVGHSNLINDAFTIQHGQVQFEHKLQYHRQCQFCWHVMSYEVSKYQDSSA